MDGERDIQKAYKSILSHDFEKAIEWFERAIAAEPGNAAYHYKVSITYARSNKLRKAMEHASIAVELEPDREEYQYHLEHLHARDLIAQAEKCFANPELRMGEAVVLLQQAIQLDPLATEAYLILGSAYAALKDYRLAVSALEDALQLQPNNDIARQHLNKYRSMLSK